MERNKNINLTAWEEYDATQVDCWPFRRSTDVIDGCVMSVGNMVGGYHFTIEGVGFLNSEAAYIAGMFSQGTEQHNQIQEMCRVNNNGFMAKKTIRNTYADIKRADWPEMNIQWMLYVVWCKVVTNADFRKTLMAIPMTATIIEESTFQNGLTAQVWGTKNEELRRYAYARKCELSGILPTKAAIDRQIDEERLTICRKRGVFSGINAMGKILMLCQEAVANNTVPPIDVELLRSKNIVFFGKTLTFDNIPTVAM